MIQDLIPGGPADRAGAKKEDRIEQVDGVDTMGMSIAQVVDRIRGPEGTEVVLVVRQPKAKEARTLKMVRGTLFLPTVTGLRKRSSGGWDFDAGGSTTRSATCGSRILPPARRTNCASLPRSSKAKGFTR